MTNASEAITLIVDGGWDIQVIYQEEGKKWRVIVSDDKETVKEIVETDRDFVRLETI